MREATSLGPAALAPTHNIITQKKDLYTPMKQSYLFLADGFEEIEALTTVDVM